MKLLKRVSILAVLITVIAVFAGCGKEATVVGTWEGDDYTYTFLRDFDNKKTPNYTINIIRCP